MWTTKTFKTKEAWQKWVDTKGHKYQWQEIYVNNAYGVIYKALRTI